jgi:hypothetical protein
LNLSSSDGTSVILRPVAYEFPDSHDAVECDWLVIEVSATTTDGTWSSRDACLTTRDAPGIAEWLRGVAASSVPASLPDADGDITPDLTFLEPALAFSLAPNDDGLKHLRVHLTYGLAPPWLDIDDALNMWSFFVEVALSDTEILAASDAWRAELVPFPER